MALIFQEKKGQEQIKPEEREAMRRDFEYSKLEKLLSMLRQPDLVAKVDDKSSKKDDKSGDK